MKFWFIVLLLGSALGFANVEGLPRGYVISQYNQEVVLKYLRPALLSREGAGRIYYSAACKTKDSETLPFPRVECDHRQKGQQVWSQFARFLRTINTSWSQKIGPE
jgi:hypothetical protein